MCNDRFDPYAFAHRGLRTVLRAAAEGTLSTDYADNSQVSALDEQIRRVLRFVELHSLVEEEFLKPAIERMELGAAVENDAEHWDMTLDVGNLHGLLQQLRSGVNRPAVGAQLAETFARFETTCRAHFDDEEAKLGPILRRHYSDDELRELHVRAFAAMPEPDLDLTLEIVLPTLCETDAAELLRQVRP